MPLINIKAHVMAENPINIHNVASTISADVNSGAAGAISDTADAAPLIGAPVIGACVAAGKIPVEAIDVVSVINKTSTL